MLRGDVARARRLFGRIQANLAASGGFNPILLKCDTRPEW
jgi:hypothetical protein